MKNNNHTTTAVSLMRWVPLCAFFWALVIAACYANPLPTPTLPINNDQNPPAHPVKVGDLVAENGEISFTLNNSNSEPVLVRIALQSEAALDAITYSINDTPIESIGDIVLSSPLTSSLVPSAAQKNKEKRLGSGIGDNYYNAVDGGGSSAHVAISNLENGEQYMLQIMTLDGNNNMHDEIQQEAVTPVQRLYDYICPNGEKSNGKSTIKDEEKC